MQNENTNAGQNSEKSKVAAGLLAIFLGAFGAHKFYLRSTGLGILYLLVTILSLGMLAWIIWIISFIEGIIYLTKSDEEFERKYVN